MERKSKKKWTEEELRETYKRLIHQMVDAEDDVERLKEITRLHCMTKGHPDKSDSIKRT